MLDLYAEVRRIADTLESAGIPYAVVGGFAVSIYAVPRATEDIDVLVDRDDLARTITALEPLGFRQAGRLMRVAAGRLEIQRLIKIDGADLLPLDLVGPVDPDLAALLTGRIPNAETPARLSTGPGRPLLVRLPHVETPAETERLRRFDALVTSPGSTTVQDLDALASGWARWWAGLGAAPDQTG